MKRALLVSSLVALAFASCGGDLRLSKPQYEKVVSSVGDQIGNELDRTFNDPSLQDPHTLKEGAGVVRRAQAAIASAADDLEDVRPPAEVESLHLQLIEGLRELASDFGGLAHSFETADLLEIQKFQQSLSQGELPSMKKITAAIAGMKAKGYDVGS